MLRVYTTKMLNVYSYDNLYFLKAIMPILIERILSKTSLKGIYGAKEYNTKW